MEITGILRSPSEAWNHKFNLIGVSLTKPTGGLWVGKFLKTVTYQRMTREASRSFAAVAARQCETEGLLAHKITADVRGKRYQEDT